MWYNGFCFRKKWKTVLLWRCRKGDVQMKNNAWVELWEKSGKKILAIAVAVFLCVSLGFQGPDTEASSGTPAVPKLKALTSTGYDSLKLTWEKASKADGYYVYRKNDEGKWKRISTVKSGKTVSYKDTGLTTGKTYVYTVRAYRKINGETRKSGYVKEGISGKPLPGKTVLSSFSRQSSTSVKLGWKKVAGAGGYRIYRKTSAKEKYGAVKDITSGSTVSFVDKDLKKGQTYYYTIKAFRTVNGKRVYGHAADTAKWNGKVVVLDPGHQLKGDSSKEPLGPGSSEKKAKVTGGTEGCVTKLPEYQLNLDVALKLGKELQKRGYQVIYTRKTNDVNISNAERAQIANNAKADAFVRIHANSSDDSKVNGAMTICQTSRNPYNASCYKKSRKLSVNVLNQLVEATGCKKEKVWETDSMSGINWSKVPVTIVEMGYMSNPTEDRNMASDSYQKKIAAGIADGIDKTLLK